MTLDIRTLMIMLALTGVLTSGALLVLRRLHLAIPGINWWAAANSVAAAGLVLSAARNYWPDLLTIVLANMLMVGANALSLTGCLLFAGRKPRKWLAPVSMAAMALFLSWYTFVDDRIVLRIHVIFLACAALCFWAGLALIRGGQTTARRVTGGVYLLFASFCVLRSVLSYGVQITDLLQSGPLTAVTFVGMFVFLLAVTLGQVVMTTEQLQADLQRQASRDWLTDVLNRRAFRLVAQKELARIQRSGGAVALLVMDLDYFKQINDRHGHAAGDEMLKAFVAVAQSTLREQDVFCRHGGEEFVAVLPDTDEAGALAVAERLRAVFAATRIQVDGRLLGTTVSVGVAQARAKAADLDELLRRADLALYEAKAGGRDRVFPARPHAVAPETAG